MFAKGLKSLAWIVFELLRFEILRGDNPDNGNLIFSLKNNGHYPKLFAKGFKSLACIVFMILKFENFSHRVQC